MIGYNMFLVLSFLLSLSIYNLSITVKWYNGASSLAVW